MIATEEGLTFAKEGTAWRCLQVPGLWMLSGGVYAIRGATREFDFLGATASCRPGEHDKQTGPIHTWQAGLSGSLAHDRLAPNRDRGA